MPSFSRVKVADIFHRLVSTPSFLGPAFSVPRARPQTGPAWWPSPARHLIGFRPRMQTLRWGGYRQGPLQENCPAGPLTCAGPQGPLSVFSAKNRWRLVGPVHVTRGEGGFGFTLRGDSPVLIAAVIPGGHAAVRAPVLPPGPSLCLSVGGVACRGRWDLWAEAGGCLGGASDRPHLPAGSRPTGRRLYRVSEWAAMQVVEARRGGGPAEERG